jgi:hypothetical protein
MDKKDLLKKIKQISLEKKMSVNEVNSIYIQIVTVIILTLKLFFVTFFQSRFF